MSQICEHGYFPQRIGDGPCDICAELRALADVRTLDEGQGSWEMDQDASGWIVLDNEGINISGKRCTTPDEARAKAAAWVRDRGE